MTFPKTPLIFKACCETNQENYFIFFHSSGTLFTCKKSCLLQSNLKYELKKKIEKGTLSVEYSHWAKFKEYSA